MRAMFVSLDATWQGRVRAFAEAARLLRGRGFAPTLMVPEGSDVARRVTVGGADVRTFPAERRFWGRMRALRAALRAVDAGVIFVQSEREHLLASLAVLLGGRGVIVRRFGSGEGTTRSWRGRLAERLKPAGYLLTTRPAIRGRILTPRAGQVTNGEIGTDVAASDHERARRPSTESTRVIACLWGPASRGQAAGVMRMMSLLAYRHRGWRLTMIGPDTGDDELRILAAGLGISEMLVWRTTSDDARAALWDADCVWVTGHGDDAAYGALDGMALALPVLSQQSPLMEQFVSDGLSGYLVKKFDPPAMADVTTVLLADDERLRKMGLVARGRAERDYPQRNQTDGYERAARLATERARGRRP